MSNFSFVNDVNQKMKTINEKAMATNDSKYFRQGFSRPVLNLWKQYSRSAKQRRIDFDIDLRDFATLVNNPCFYCGVFPSRRRNCFHGLDRVRNEVCYVKYNVVPCCSTCNYMKGALSLQEFLDQCHKVNQRRERIMTNFEHIENDMNRTDKLSVCQTVPELEKQVDILSLRDLLENNNKW